MATDLELFGLSTEGQLQKRVTVACAIVAHGVLSEGGEVPNHNNRLAWAARVQASPQAEAGRMIWPVLAANEGSTAEQIRTATSGQIQAAVSAAIDLFAQGE